MSDSHPAKPTRSAFQWGPILLVASALSLFFFWSVQRAWLGDDVYITLRTVDNLVNGYGLTWNVAERVQVFTHPLWMFLLSGCYFFTRESFYTSIALSLSVSMLAALALVFGAARSRTAGALGLFVLSLSGAFLDYAGAGLENPLTHLLLAVFAMLYFSGSFTPRRLFWLSLVASLAAFNRMDALLLYLPALAYAFWQARSWRGLGWMALGQMPLVGWELFSVIYYGFLFPNTAYAKLNNAMSGAVLLQQGGQYLLFTLTRDPLTLAGIAIALVLAVLSRRRALTLSFAAGMLLYLGYVVKIGGDFMGGRFFTAPLFCAVLVMVQIPFEFKRPRLWLSLAVGAVLLAACAAIPPWKIWYANPDIAIILPNGIADERAFYIIGNGLITSPPGTSLPAFKWRYQGEDLRKSGARVSMQYSIGLVGYFAGPQVHIVDLYAITDPLLARMPPFYIKKWRIGHFLRPLPDGYLQTIELGTDQFADARLGAYYAHLHNITSGKLFDRQRWVDIWKMNTGQYDALIDWDYYRNPPERLVHIPN